MKSTIFIKVVFRWIGIIKKIIFNKQKEATVVNIYLIFAIITSSLTTNGLANKMELRLMWEQSKT